MWTNCSGMVKLVITLFLMCAKYVLIITCSQYTKCSLISLFQKLQNKCTVRKLVIKYSIVDFLMKPLLFHIFNHRWNAIVCNVNVTNVV